MKTKIYSVLFLFCISFFTGLQLFAQTNHAALDAFVKAENLKHAAIGFCVVDLSSGKTIAYNENIALTSASTMKIVTTATALEFLGCGFRYKTPLYYDGVIQNSVLKGNLYIEGVGDPTLGSEFIGIQKENFLNEWATALQNLGIKTIAGDVIVLDQLFGYEGVSPKWMKEDLGNYYASGIYGISAFDNMYRLHFQTFQPGTDAVFLSMEPFIKEIQLTNELKAGTSNTDLSLIFGVPFAYQRHIHGTIPSNRTSFAVKGDIPDPGLFLAQTLVDYLQNQNIEVKGKTTTYRLTPQNPTEKTEIITTCSPSMTTIVRVINVRSNNHYADHLYQRMKAVDKLDFNDYWKRKGLNSSGLFIFDGSGLSPVNAVSAKFLTDILLYMDNKEGTTGAFYKSLPIAGKEGTVVSFLKNTPLDGKVRVKSGSITNVQSYAGYIEKADKRYAFAILVNNYTGTRADVRKEIEKLLVGLP
jgi:D-alanyl-D-alanine carboxypeptidase/D-alanyl-D-alanine-endopeptidase (penicillin-binding protein 4)